MQNSKNLKKRMETIKNQHFDAADASGEQKLLGEGESRRGAAADTDTDVGAEGGGPGRQLAT